MKRTNKKKGFTLVELIVVIAILAILATVSIVGYVSFTKKAEKSNDISLTTQINTALEAAEALNKPKTLSEANAVLKEMGVDLSKLSPTSDGHSFVWNSETNRVVLLDKDKKVVFPEGATFDASQSVAVVHKQSEISNWAGSTVYLAADFEPEGDTLEVNTGVDVGESSVKNVVYKNEGAAQDVMINTNGGKLTVNAPQDNVTHYGVADEVDIQAVKPKSYHEKGTVAFIQIASGHLVVEKGGKVLLVQRTDAAATVENNGGTVEAAVATSDALKIELSGVTCEVKTQEEINALKEEKIEQNVSETVEAGNNVARIGRECYATLEEAIAAAKGGDTIVVLKDITRTTATAYKFGTKGSPKTITLDLNGHEITTGKPNQIVFNVYDNLTICGKGKIISKSSGTIPGINVWDKGTLTIDGPTITYDKGENSLGGTLIKVQKGASLILNSGKLVSSDTHTKTSNDGTFADLGAIYVLGNFTMNGGTVESGNGYAICVESKDASYKTVISDGTIKGHKACVFAKSALSKTDISGGEFWISDSTCYDYALNKLDSVQGSASFEVSGGTFHNFDPAHSADTPEQSYVKAGYKSQLKSGTTNVYEVVAQ